MEHLFKTAMEVEGKQIPFEVVFDHERYIFQPGEGSQLGEFTLERTHDVWKDEGDLAPGLRQQAVDALERYLMKQH